MIEIIQYSSDIRFGFKEQHINSCMFCCPKLGKLMQEWKKRAFLHVCHSFCWLLSSVQMDPKQKVYATVLLGGATHAGISPLPCYQKKKRAWSVIWYLNCLHIACPGEALMPFGSSTVHTATASSLASRGRTACYAGACCTNASCWFTSVLAADFAFRRYMRSPSIYLFP